MFTVLAVVFAVYVGVQLIPAGISKFDAENSAATFATLGGDKVRYFVGLVEVAGPLLLMYSGTALLGAALISSVMLGAIYLHVAIWKNSPKNAALVLGSTLVSLLFHLL
jgi:uncharacterized membrane protein YphA (DoxX/SURF4 family)